MKMAILWALEKLRRCKCKMGTIKDLTLNIYSTTEAHQIINTMANTLSRHCLRQPGIGLW
jgi:hypothetical protein